MDTGGMSWSVHAVPLPDGDRPADLWVDEAGCLTSEPVPAAEYRRRLHELLPLAHRLGVPILTGTDTAGSVAREVALLAEHGLEPTAALEAATTTGYRFLGESFDTRDGPATLVTYQHDPREDLAALSSPAAVVISGIRVR